jgi:AraC family transcriptional regulator
MIKAIKSRAFSCNECTAFDLLYAYTCFQRGIKMDWVNKMNDAITYIEEHITEDISYSEAARVACCSTYHFQRMFSYITDVPLSEYIRRRRLTLAAFELQNSRIKVIDLALKYNYDSPEAFTRAFHALHGLTPTEARKAGTKLKAYPRISFQLTIKGVTELNYRIETLSEFSIVGIRERIRTQDAFHTVPQIWAGATEQGLLTKLWEMRMNNHALQGILGVCADGDFGANEEFDYIMAVVSDQTPPKGMTSLDFPPTMWAVFDIDGPPERLQEIWKRLYTEWVPTSAYELAHLPAIECYLPREAHRNELWVPIMKKGDQ